MTKTAAARTPTSTLEQLAQRALVAWRRLSGGTADALSVDTLQKERARTILRLAGVGPDGEAVIGKRCQRHVAEMERHIYEQLLPGLPFPTLGVYGLVAEEDSPYAWLFMEDAGACNYDPARRTHQVLLAQAVGRLHTLASRIARPPGLQNRGCKAFRIDLQEALQSLETAMTLPHLSSEDAALLRSLHDRLQLLARHWQTLASVGASLPQTLIHGDLKQDHIFVRAESSGEAVVLIDWHVSGWGEPGLDAAKFLGYSVCPDLEAYLAVVGGGLPGLTRRVVLRLGWIGEACRCVASVRWQAEKLFYKPPEACLPTLVVYSNWLSDVLAAEPWAETPALGLEARRAPARGWN